MLTESGNGHVAAPPMDHGEVLRDFYADSLVRPLWVRDREIGRRGKRLLDRIEEVTSEGLRPGWYRNEFVRSSLERLDRAEGLEEAALVELALSDAFLRLADDLGRGRDPGPSERSPWEIHRDSVPHLALLEGLRSGHSPGEELDELRPLLPWYEPMTEALARYREAEREGGWPTVPTGETLSLGDTSAAVAAVRERLRRGLDPIAGKLAGRGRADEVYDEKLAEAVGVFQKRHGILVDSVAGPGTVAAMNVSASERVASLELNLDRLRRMPRNPGARAIVVNVAGFELVVLEDHEPVMEMDVVVGRPEWRTNIFQGQLEYVVVNPYWHVPESIEDEEILPKVREDPQYLERKHLVLVDPDDSYGPPIPAFDVDWHDVDSTSFPYDFRQESGPENALGRIKFMFPNEHNIYLHDTPADALFTRDMRAFSHGCIRVEEPMELAHYVLEHASATPPGRLEELLRQGERTRLELDRPLPVYIAYFTAWAEPNGRVRFYPDIYERDEAGFAEGTDG